MSLHMFLKIVSIILLSFSTCHADNWSINQKKALPGEKDENRIIKWCDKETGKKVRYASANIALKGYEPCGSIKSVDVCDENGNKFLGQVPKKGIFSQCNAPLVKEQEVNDQSETDFTNTEGTNSKESFSDDDISLNELKREIKKVEEIHNSDPEVKMQILADNLMKGIFGKGNKNLADLLDKKKQKEMFKQFVPILESYMQLLDKDTQKAVKPLIEHVKKTMTKKP